MTFIVLFFYFSLNQLNTGNRKTNSDRFFNFHAAPGSTTTKPIRASPSGMHVDAVAGRGLVNPRSRSTVTNTRRDGSGALGGCGAFRSHAAFQRAHVRNGGNRVQHRKPGWPTDGESDLWNGFPDLDWQARSGQLTDPNASFSFRRGDEADPPV